MSRVLFLFFWFLGRAMFPSTILYEFLPSGGWPPKKCLQDSDVSGATSIQGACLSELLHPADVGRRQRSEVRAVRDEQGTHANL